MIRRALARALVHVPAHAHPTLAEAVVAGVCDERFLILPHEEVAHHMALKGAQPERWLNGMRRIVRNARAQTPTS